MGLIYLPVDKLTTNFMLPCQSDNFGVVQNTVTDFWLIDNCAPFLSHENNDEIILQ